ncbi:MAG: HAMP domain-containing histidine kinase [Bacteroidales bacterium]|nr:HAMP domain-containing histidine kinase [Bacteroidales bacterium]
MNTSYAKWKWIFFAVALIVFTLTIWYSNILIDNIAQDERNKIKIWANAIQRKASLVKYTNEFFEKIQIEEQNKAKVMAKAFERINTATPYEDISFYTELISKEQTIPYILADKDGNISATKNLDKSYLASINTPQKLKKVLQEENYDTIRINYYKDFYIYLYYKESHIYTQLRDVFNDLLVSFLTEIVENSSNVPVIVTDSSKTKVIAFGNIDTSLLTTPLLWSETIKTMESEKKPIKISLSAEHEGFVFYQESYLLKRLRYFPIIQIILVVIFFIVAYILFSFAWHSEQNKVWVGMSKETAHQLGTPLSSLMAWAEILRSENVNPEIINEIEKDITRLEVITQRFSKIGSTPNLSDENIQEVICDFIEYFKNRTPDKITFDLKFPKKPIYIHINKYLFEWVIENLCKNAVDAMNGEGVITILLIEEKKHVLIDVIDSGKGINTKNQKNIFKPGFTTKNRGWGLGLTLTQRIIKNYHKGSIDVKTSIPNKETILRIKLKKNKKL